MFPPNSETCHHYDENQGSGSIRCYYYLVWPFHSALEILEEVQQSNPVDSQEDCSDPEEKYSAFRAQPGRSSRKLWKKNSQIFFIGCSFLVFNWVDSLVVDPDELLLAVSHLFAVTFNPRFSFMGGIGKK